MIVYKTDEEIEKIRESNILVCKTLAYVASLIKPGANGAEIDKKAESFILDHNAIPAFKGYRGFPYSLCVSINEQVVHGFPTSKELKDGDIISVDCGIDKDGFFGDAAYTFALGNVSDKVMNLLSVTKKSLYKGIEQAIEGKRVGDIGWSIQDFTERQHGYGVVRELVGHGVGKAMHEDPEVPNYGKRGNGLLLRSGMVIAIEPMITLGKRDVRTLNDQWTIVTRDLKPAAHFEHSIAVRKNKADILSDHSFIEIEIKNNLEIREIQ